MSRLYNPTAAGSPMPNVPLPTHGAVSELVNVPKDLAFFGKTIRPL